MNYQNKKNNNNTEQPKMPKFNMNWVYAIVLVVLAVLFFTGAPDRLTSGSVAKEASIAQFNKYLEKDMRLM